MEPGEIRSLCFSSRVAEGRRAGGFAREAAHSLFPATDCDNIELAIVEAFTNIVEHAYGSEGDHPVWVTIRRQPETLEFSLEDEASASGFNPAAVPEPAFESGKIEDLPEGGWGVYLMTQFMDAVSQGRNGPRNCLRLSKGLPAGQRLPAVFSPPAASPAAGLLPAAAPGPAVAMETELASRDEIIREMAEELSTAYETQSFLYAFTRDYAALTDESALLLKVLENAASSAEADWVTVRLLQPQAATHRASIGRVPAVFQPSDDGALAIEARVVAGGREEVTAPVAGSAVMCLPIRGRESLLGTLLISGTARAVGFTAGDVELARSLAYHAGISLENQRLFREATAANRIRDQLEIAHRVQQQLYPQTVPDVPELLLFAEGRPARQVGGDYLALLPRPDGTVHFLIADAMGKGMEAAFFSVLTHMAFRSILDLQPQASPGAIMTYLNRVLNHDFERFQMYMTALCGQIDTRNNRLSYASAGHCQPILTHPDGRTVFLETPDFMLGVQAGTVYQQRDVPFLPGMRLLTYTDGFTDTVDDHCYVPGPEPLRAKWEALWREPLRLACRKIMDDAEAAAPPEGLADDIALLAIERIVAPRT